MTRRWPARLARSARLAPLLLALTGPGPLWAEDPAPAPVPPQDPSQAVAQALRQLNLAEGMVADQVVLFPLYVLTDPGPVEALPAVTGRTLRVSEPEVKPGKELVRVANGEPKPILLLAGTVLEGGKLDRMVRYDTLVAPSDAVDVEVWPAAMASDVRKTPTPFALLDFLAPSYLREAGQFTRSGNAVPRFVSHFLEFRNPGETRRSLPAVGRADTLADYCLVCQRSFSEWPTKKGAGTVVGGIAVVRGRLQTLEVFANNQHLQDFFAPVLKSLSFPAAALDLRAKKVGLPLPGKDEPAGSLEAATKLAKDLLAALPGATYQLRKTAPGFLGEAWVIQAKDGTRGSALMHQGRLMHASLYPEDPFESALYSTPLAPLDPEDASGDALDETSRAELESRLARGGRLTPAEQRLLARLRSRGALTR